jgi:hypothetical protein
MLQMRILTSNFLRRKTLTVKVVRSPADQGSHLLQPPAAADKQLSPLHVHGVAKSDQNEPDAFLKQTISKGPPLG